MPTRKLNTENLANRIQKPEDVYPFIIDCGLDKKGNMLIYELQPLVCSGLGGIDSRRIPAFKKAFPGLSFTLDYKGIQYPPEESAVTKGFFSDIPPRENSKYENVKIPKFYIKITLPNRLPVYQILMETLMDTKAEITRELTSEKAVVDLSLKL
ncbi:hypothetical protein [Rickettsiella endosymbiont of Rhagonycha lignosa]|uniref:hypothetical protein n=1 Tax=Rickettsiella endosymbiont of Rhagonycha lignosa TaxID=3077937 RepID=UPI00313AD2FD